MFQIGDLVQRKFAGSYVVGVKPFRVMSTEGYYVSDFVVDKFDEEHNPSNLVLLQRSGRVSR